MTTTTKTWEKAKLAHKDRMAWCISFGEVLLALERAGAPVPDLVGAAHADWATVHGVLRIGMTLRGAVKLMTGFPLPWHVREALGAVEATAETLEQSAALWAGYLCEVYCGTLQRSDAGLPKFDLPTETYQPDETNPERDVERLVDARVVPYWQPSGVKR